MPGSKALVMGRPGKRSVEQAWKWNDMPWDFYLDCVRWAYDESRHCMMGEERMQS